MDNDWLAGPNLNKLKREKRLVVAINGEEVLLLWLNQDVLAIENTCPHQGFPLERGSLNVDSRVLSCPFHGWRFDLLTGKCLHAQVSVPTYQVKLDGIQIWLRKQT